MGSVIIKRHMLSKISFFLIPEDPSALFNRPNGISSSLLLSTCVKNTKNILVFNSHHRSHDRIDVHKNIHEMTTQLFPLLPFIHSRLDCCNSLFLHLPVLQLIVVFCSFSMLLLVLPTKHKCSLTSPRFKTHHYLNINNELIELFSLTYKAELTNKPVYSRNLLIIQPFSSIRFSSLLLFCVPLLFLTFT
jgi:hypothetical protein